MSASVLVCVTARKECAALIERGRALAVERGLPLRVLHVAEARGAQPSAKETTDILNELFRLSHVSDAEMEALYENDVPGAIARYARGVHAQVVVVGRGRGGHVRDLPALLPECEIDVCE